MADINVEIPLDEILDRRYLHLKSYFNDFINKVEQSKINASEYVAVVSVKKKGGESELDRSAFG